MADQMQNAIGKGFGLAMDGIYNSLIGKGPASALRKKDLTKFSAEDLWALANVVPGGTGKVVKEAAAITPAGLKAVAATGKAVKRSPLTSALETLAQNTVNSKAASVYGPGSYFATDMGSSVNRWRNYGDKLSGIATTPSAKLKIAQSKGYATPEQVQAAIAQNSAPGTSILNAQMTDPAIQKLIGEGYVGLKNPQDGVLTSWILGNPGVSRKALGNVNPATQMWEKPANLTQKTYNYVRGLEKNPVVLDSKTNKDILKKVVQSKKDALNLVKKAKDKKAETAFLNRPTVEG